MISENLQTLAETKERFKTAFANKGVDLTNVPFTQYPEKLNEIQTGGSEENKLAKLVSGQEVEIKASDLEGAANIANYCFYQKTNLKSIEIPDSVTSIGNNAFYSCSGLTEVKISNNAATFGNSVFYNCSQLKNINLPTEITTISDNLFYNCKALENIVIPDKVTDMYNSAFYNSGIKNITIPKSVKNISSGLFQYCYSLIKVVFEGQTPKIPSYCFQGNNKITLYDFSNCTTIPTLANTSSLGHASGCQIVIPDALYDEWTTANVWKDVTNVVWVKKSEYVES